MNIQARKQALRQRIIAARDAEPDAERLHWSHAVVGSLCAMQSYQTAQTVLGYMNFGSELVSEFFVQQALNDGRRVLLPRVNRASKQLDIFEVHDLRHDVAPGLWGIREPLAQSCTRFDGLDVLDFILLPGVAFTRDGVRLGYGGGFYDKLLAQLPHQPTLVAGAFELQVVAEIPQEDTDRKVQWLVTENETIHCAAINKR